MIVACLAWYLEPPDFLYRSITSLRGLADECIAYDGAWDLFPHARPESTPAEYEAIEAASRDSGIPVTVYTPATTWASQVEKRAALMLEAGEVTDVDWLLVIDGDEWIDRAEPHAARALLDSTSCDVATIMHLRVTGCDAVNVPGPIRRIYRASCGVTVDTAHNGYRTMDGRWLHGDSAAVRLEQPLDLSRYISLHHARANRGEERNRAALDYRSARLAAGAESWRG